MASARERRRAAAIAKLKLVVPALFAFGFLFFVAITIYFPLAGMPQPPLSPFGSSGSLLLWLAIALTCGGILALLGVLVVAVSASDDID